MNIDHMNNAIALLEMVPETKFHISMWRRAPQGRNFDVTDTQLKNDCGTAACIAGWIAILDEEQSACAVSIRARDYLDVENDLSDDLFLPGAAGDMGFDARMKMWKTITIYDAIEVMTRLRDTGEVQWAEVLGSRWPA